MVFSNKTPSLRGILCVLRILRIDRNSMKLEEFQEIKGISTIKCRTKKRAFHIHPSMSRHKMPKQLITIFVNFPKYLKKYCVPKQKNVGPKKKIRAFHIHSNMSRHEMPKQLEKNVSKYPPKIKKNTEFQNRKMWDQKKNQGIPHPLKYEQT